MRSTNNAWAGDINWDGTPKRRPSRSLRIASDSPTRLLRADQRRRCADCGNLIDWYYRSDGRPVSLHPVELDAATVPEAHQWHVHSGIAHPDHDGSPWCRIPHLALCPARQHTNTDSWLADLRRRLAAATRCFIDNGILDTHAEAPAAAANVTSSADGPQRAVVQFLYTRYLAPGPLETIQCVGQTRTRQRCSRTLTDDQPAAGEWHMTPAHPLTGDKPTLLSDITMAVYHLDHLPYAEQLRWHAQRCTVHAAATSAADTTLTEWEPFNPHTHHQHIRSEHPDQPSTAGRLR